MSSTAAAGSFVVIAEFEVQPEQLDAFLVLVQEDAERSLADEPGCLQFDVLVEGEGTSVVLYEVYDSRAAFDAHLQTPHLAKFRAGFPALATQRPTRFLQRRHP